MLMSWMKYWRKMNMNRNQYIKQVLKLLGCSKEQKKKIRLDLENDIDIALKNNESFDEIIKRMGAPEELACEFNENMGVTPPRSHKKMILIIVGIVLIIILAAYLFVLSLMP